MVSTTSQYQHLPSYALWRNSISFEVTYCITPDLAEALVEGEKASLAQGEGEMVSSVLETFIMEEGMETTTGIAVSRWLMMSPLLTYSTYAYRQVIPMGYTKIMAVAQCTPKR